jgi:peptidoglycan-associated lipoprotein
MQRLFLSKLLKIMAVASMALLLAACSGKKPAASAQETGVIEDASGASAAGVGAENGFGEASDNIHTVCHPSVGNDHYYFDFDQDIIHENDMAALRNQINYITSHNHITVRVEGNTDERGSKEYNIALGHRRANAVARLLKQNGVPFSRIKLISYGEEKPIAFEHDENSWQCNRRVDLVYGNK